MTVEDADPRHWHQALAYALLGRRLDDLGAQREPDLEALSRRLQRETSAESLAADARGRARAGKVWPYRVPADLMAGLGFAQFASALQVLQRELGLDAFALSPPRVGRPQPVDAAERRLLDDVPPHHGS